MENPDALVPQKRPQLLQVICILSFISCGILILIGLFDFKNLFMSVEEILAEEKMQMLQQMYPESYEAAVKALQFKNVNAIFGVLTPILSLIGVLLMWNLKKQGFFIYVFAEILPYVLIMFTTGFASLANMGGMMENFQSIINVVLILVVLIDILFIILYALNLKHMS
jgi:hypothetical protein